MTIEQLDFLVGCVEVAKYSYLRVTPDRLVSVERIQKFNNMIEYLLSEIYRLKKESK
jgi:hypothetical protein